MAFVYYERKEVHQLENQEQPLKNPIKEHITFWYQLIKPTILPWMKISTYWVKSFKHCISLTRLCFSSFITGTYWRSECYFCSQHDEGCCFALCPSLQSSGFWMRLFGNRGLYWCTDVCLYWTARGRHLWILVEVLYLHGQSEGIVPRKSDLVDLQKPI